MLWVRFGCVCVSKAYCAQGLGASVSPNHTVRKVWEPQCLQPNPNVAFGQGGPHFCLGMWLARMEIRIVLELLCQRVARLEMLEEPSWTRSNFICGVKRLPLRVHLHTGGGR